MYNSLPKLKTAQKLLEEHWGEIGFYSPSFEVTPFTTYYEAEMGTGIQKQFMLFTSLVSVEEANQSAKFLTNRLEAQLSDSNGRRTVNLDPGYLTLDKVVLYTTKNHAHRLYITKGCYAEITLRYHRGSFHPLPHTYPDYQTSLALEFFNQARELLRQQLKSLSNGSQAL